MIAEPTGLAEPGTGRADRSVPARFSVTLVEDVEVVGTESGDAPGVRLEVVQQHDGLQAERLGERGAVDGPRDVRHADAAVANRAGDTEAGRSGLGRMHGQERPHHLLERRMLAARVDLQRHRLTRILVDERQPRIRTTDIPRQDHRS